VARVKNIRLHLHRAGNEPAGVPNLVQAGCFKAIVNIKARRVRNLRAGNAGGQKQKTGDQSENGIQF
jgi:hypothetical protein